MSRLDEGSESPQRLRSALVSYGDIRLSISVMVMM
jgi:hypothetical protein